MTIFLDSNAGAPISKSAIDEYVKWCAPPGDPFFPANPSTHYGQNSKEVICNFREKVLDMLGTNCSEYQVIITSGASESNSGILSAIKHKHVIISSIEHKSLLLSNNKNVVEPRDGFIEASDISKAIKDDTTLICVQWANNETGAIMDMRAIWRACKTKKGSRIILHSDITAAFGKTPINLREIPVDSLALSLYKVGTLPGIGVWIIRKDLLESYTFKPQIYGMQNFKLRGGTENVPLIASSLRVLNELRLMNEDIKKYLFAQLKDFPVKIISGIGNKWVCNTVLLLCNKNTDELVRALKDKKIIVGKGSACNARSNNHVAQAMGFDGNNIIRISFWNIERADIDKFIAAFSLLRHLIQ